MNDEGRPVSLLRLSLVLIPVIVLFGAMLLGPVLPGHLRDKVCLPACVNNLKHIDMAKQRWALDNGTTNVGTHVAVSNIVPLLIGQEMPECPNNGFYSINPIGHRARCSVHGMAPRRPQAPEEKQSTPKETEEGSNNALQETSDSAPSAESEAHEG